MTSDDAIRDAPPSSYLQRLSGAWRRAITDKLSGPTIKFPRPRADELYWRQQLSPDRKVRKEVATADILAKAQEMGAKAKAAQKSRVEGWTATGKYHGSNGLGEYPANFREERSVKAGVEADRKDLRDAEKKRRLIEELFHQQRKLEEVQWRIEYATEAKDRLAVPMLDVDEERAHEAKLQDSLAGIEGELKKLGWDGKWRTLSQC